MNCDVQSKFLTITEIEDGFPHSDILGSKLVRSSPRLIAAYHVLHRLLAPRHPPDTLKTLDHSHYQYPLTHKLIQNVSQRFGLMRNQYPLTHKLIQNVSQRFGLMRNQYPLTHEAPKSLTTSGPMLDHYPLPSAGNSQWQKHPQAKARRSSG